MKNVIFFIIILIFLAACTHNQGSENLYRENEVRDETTLISNPINREELRMRDGQNPNIPHTDGRRLYNQADVEKARQIVNGTGEYRAGRIWINGDDMWVTAYKKGMLSDRQRVSDSAALRKKLLRELPRYHIQVKIQEVRS